MLLWCIRFHVTKKQGYKPTLSLLAGINLLTGVAIPIVSETHKSSDFITLLKKLDVMYPEGDIIRIVCDNHSAHKSKETRFKLNKNLKIESICILMKSTRSLLFITGHISLMK